MHNSLLKMRLFSIPYLLSLFGLLLTGCGGLRTFTDSIRPSPHEKYAASLKSAQLDKTALGEEWIRAAERALVDSLQMPLPFLETGYFDASQPKAAAYRISVKRGEKIAVLVTTKSLQPMRVFVDVFEFKGQSLKRVASADSTQTLEYEVRQDGPHLVRLQPELLRSGQYTITIQIRPSLAFPVKGKGNAAVGSLFGVDREAGRRLHEGVDIFAPKGTPALATVSGFITSVNENNMGGKVVWLQDVKRGISFYYAHLDRQLVQTGQSVKPGDTLGLIGNTGNARTTPSHLHFGAYAGRGAIDPYPFIRQNDRLPKPLLVDDTLLGQWARVSSAKAGLRISPSAKSNLLANLPVHTMLWIEAGTDQWFRATLPGGPTGYVSASALIPIAKPLQSLKLSTTTPLLDYPNALAAPKDQLPEGVSLRILGRAGAFAYVQSAQGQVGWIEVKGKAITDSKAWLR